MYLPSSARLYLSAALASGLLIGCQRKETSFSDPEPTLEKAGTSPALSPADASVPEGVLFMTSKPEEARRLPLVENGEAKGVLVVDTAYLSGESDIAQAVAHFVDHVERSTKVRLRIVSWQDAAELPPEVTRLAIGPSPEAEALGLSLQALESESYRLLSKGNTLYVLGAPSQVVDASSPLAPRSRPTLWALNKILGEELGIRWLWPGKLGTYVPRQTSLTLPVYDLTYQPKLVYRVLRYNPKRPLGSSDGAVDSVIKDEARSWAENHLWGGRTTMHFGHAFGYWWSRYSEKHPDYFADLGPDLKQPKPYPRGVKLRLSNPAVIARIASEYITAGKPKYYNVGPNDGSFFDISPETRAWDIPHNQDTESIFSSRANLTARYVEFWNRLYARLVTINPDVVLTTFAYSAYRMPPPPERPLKAKAVFAIVPELGEYDVWKGWADTGSQLFLRPNWWHLGGDAPYITIKEAADYIKFANQNGMIGIDMDSIIGYWGTQGINYYATARLMTNPELTVDDILDEYTAAFGAGAREIRDYIAYWQGLVVKYRYAHLILDHQQAEHAARSEYAKLVAEGKIPASILSGSKYALPYLYSEEVLKPAERYLDEAAVKIGANDPEALARVGFLRNGLVSLRATREQVALGERLKKSLTREMTEKFARGDEELKALRDRLAPSHVVWGEAAADHEDRYRVLIRPKNLGGNNINLNGM